jgi:hypothetical protein
MSKFALIVIVAASASFLVMGGHSLLPRAARPVGAGVSPSCGIKGNISIDSGERIYHLPGQLYYEDTRIRPEYGDRWFCSEADARAAGWRRARR